MTAEYLNHCREIEIKVAQGAKPGEGGQLPGFKVTEMIAKLRHSTPGVMLISPPPHHDIYSIEDLAQLIYDLKQINPDAQGLREAGGALRHRHDRRRRRQGEGRRDPDLRPCRRHRRQPADQSIKYAGVPWEMGLSEAHQVLTLNNLRHRVRLRTDGGMQHRPRHRDRRHAGRRGVRHRHGVAGGHGLHHGAPMPFQHLPGRRLHAGPKLREKFTGTPEKVVNLISFIAEEVREILAALGFRTLNEVIGRTDLLAPGQPRRGPSGRSRPESAAGAGRPGPACRATARWKAATKCRTRWTRR